ncbi:MAG: hypothetical protein AMJ63_11340 [Myxococcales bacterium SG8_38_1]|nr:MAG: hypothetical protein AMJ63_11340 [Myxococcales bacterium SG8_38_1]
MAVGLAFFLILGCDSQTEGQGRAVSVASPSGDLKLAVATDDQGRMSYTVTKNGETVVETSPMGLVSTTHDLATGVSMSSSASRTIDESYTMVTGKRCERRVLGREITVPLEDASGARAELILRAHDDGVAFRYHLLGKGESQVMSELTGFAIPSGARVITRAYDGGDLVFTPTAGEYQQPPILLPLGEAIDRTGFAFPTMFELGRESLYAVVSEADLGASYCATRLNEEPRGNLYEIRFPDEREGWGVGEVLPTRDIARCSGRTLTSVTSCRSFRSPGMTRVSSAGTSTTM